MTSYSSSVSAEQILNQVCQLLALDSREVLEAARLTERDCQSAMEPRHYFDLYDAIRQVFERAHGAVGFEAKLAQAYAKGPYLTPTLAYSTAPDLLSGLKRLARYKPLIAPVFMEIRSDGDVVDICLRALADDLTMPCSMALFEMFFVLETAVILTGRALVPLAISLPETERSQAALEAYGLDLTCTDGAPVLRLSKADAQRVLLTANPVLWASLEPILEGELRTKVGHGITTERLAAELAQAMPDGVITAEELACRMGLSKRSLQRKLQSEGTTFQEVLNETRATLAQSYLRRSGMSVAEISHQLGFRSVSSFFRNFQAWAGMTPNAFRADRQAE